MAVQVYREGNSMIISKASTIHDDGSTTDGYFVGNYYCGMIIGAIFASIFLIGLFFMIYGIIKEENYIIPKKATKGIYLQLDDGKLWKKQ